MLFVLSPAKSLNFENKSNAKAFSTPALMEDAERLMNTLKKKSVKKLMELQSISKNLAELNFERNQIWSTSTSLEHAKQAISTFSGDVYTGLNETDFNEQDYKYAQEHLRILSGLYGVLRPLDVMQAYRLEMGTQLKTTRGKNLYEFWKLRITKQLNDKLLEFGQAADRLVVNLASDEYFKAIKEDSIKGRIVQPVFMDESNGQFKVISFFAKKARGMMVRFAIKNQLSDVEQLKAFDAEGYLYRQELSGEDRWVFTREKK